ncbi:MAG: Ig-like domain-containing protein, partial [Methyloglobulus sp.]
MKVCNVSNRCWLFLFFALFSLNNTWADDSSLTVSPSSVALNVGATANIKVSNTSGSVTASSSKTAIAAVTYSKGVATVKGVAAGAATVTIKDKKKSKQVSVTVRASTLSVSPTAV